MSHVQPLSVSEAPEEGQEKSVGYTASSSFADV